MNKQQQEKIGQFLDDKVMSDAVYGVLFDFFVRNHGEKDVYMLAARAMASDLLPGAWREVIKNRYEAPRDPKPPEQIGL